MQAQQTKEMEKGIQTSLQGLLESLRTQIHSMADESAARVAAEVKSMAEQAIQELPDQLYKSVGMAALMAKEWEEQAKTHLEAHSSHMLEVFQKQLEELTMAAQERQRRDAEALQGLLQSRLRQAARLFDDLGADAGQAKGVDCEEYRNSPSQSPRGSTDPL
jgi:vacuolar-type H+-ATPase subunit H